MRAALPSAVRWRPGSSLGSAILSLYRLGRVDVAHAHMTAGEFAVMALRRRTGGTFVATRHFAQARGRSRLARALSPWLNSAIGQQIAISQFVDDALESRADVVLHNGVRNSDAPPLPVTREVLLLQRLSPEKDTETALRAWRRSGLADVGWRLRIAGRGSEQERLQALSRTLDIQNSVEFLGFVGDAGRELARSEVVVATANSEPFGLSVVEAMSMARPVIAAAAGGHLETVGQALGARMFQAGNDEALAAELRDLCLDRTERERYGAELQRLQRHSFNLDLHVEQLLGIYAEGA